MAKSSTVPKILTHFRSRAAKAGIVSYHSVKYSSDAVKAILPHNLLEVSAQWLTANGFDDGDAVICANLAKNKAAECRIASNPNVITGSARTNTIISDLLMLSPDDEIVVAKLQPILFSRVMTQKVDDVFSESVSINAEQYAMLDKHYSQYQLIHPATGSAYIINTDKIICADNTPSGAVRLSMMQRKLLSQDAPVAIKPSLCAKICADIALDTAERELIYSLYGEDKLCCDLSRVQEDAVRKALAKVGYYRLTLVPVMESYRNNYPADRSLADSVLRFMVGGSKLVLKTARPFVTDENKLVVRISRENMNLLGIEEMDEVVLSYRDKSARAKAMCADSMDEVRSNNIIGRDSDVDLIVGIPVFLRKQLGIRDLNASVKVSRNTRFLFKKNLNIQLLPTVAILFTLIQTFQNHLNSLKDYLILTLIFLAILPFIIYIVFSELRNKVK